MGLRIMGKFEKKKPITPFEAIEAILTHPSQRNPRQKYLSGYIWSLVEGEVLRKAKKEKLLLTIKKAFDKE